MTTTDEWLPEHLAPHDGTWIIGRGQPTPNGERITHRLRYVPTRRSDGRNLWSWADQQGRYGWFVDDWKLCPAEQAITP